MINSTYQSTLKCSPAEIIFGKKLSQEWNVHEEEHTNDQKKINHHMFGITKRHFEIGDKVLVKNHFANKDKDRYEGPGIIIKKRHDRSYHIKFENGKVVIRNVEWLRDFKERGM